MSAVAAVKHYVPQTLRDYQREAVDAVKAAWSKGDNAPMVAAATGAGKTTIIAQLLLETVEPYNQRALVIAHTQEIIFQLFDRINNQFAGKLDEMYSGRNLLDLVPGIGIVMGMKDSPDARIVIATRQSLHKQRVKRLLETGVIDVLVIDEAHHALDDNTYGQIVTMLKAANPDLKIVGVTATPKRTDKKALSTIFTNIVYQWLIPDGINAGYLVPVTRVKIKTKVSLSHIKSSAGDYQQNRLVSALEAENWVDLCLKAYREHIQKTERPTLAFMPSVAMSRRFAVALQQDGIAAAHIDGDTPKDEREYLLRQFATGSIQTISNMAVLTEGFDAPRTSAVFLARPTRSQTLFTQIIGRGLRPFPGKNDCLLVDMTVTDTKALEVGTLLGRMITCKQCAADYLAGLRHCPRCGHETPKTLVVRQDDDKTGKVLPRGRYVGGELVADYEPLFQKAFAAWHMDKSWYLSCTLNFQGDALLIVPPISDKQYRMFHVPADKKRSIYLVNVNEDVASLMLDADKRLGTSAAKQATAKDAEWRSAPASHDQVRFLHYLGVKNLPEDITKGMASQLITHEVAIKRVIEYERSGGN